MVHRAGTRRFWQGAYENVFTLLPTWQRIVQEPGLFADATASVVSRGGDREGRRQGDKCPLPRNDHVNGSGLMRAA